MKDDLAKQYLTLSFFFLSLETKGHLISPVTFSDKAFAVNEDFKISEIEAKIILEQMLQNFFLMPMESYKVRNFTLRYVGFFSRI